MMIAMFLVLATVVASAPMVLVVLVSIASRREDAAYSLGGPAPGPVQAAARRILDFQSEDDNWPRPKNSGLDRVHPEVPAYRQPARTDSLQPLLRTAVK
jgi:hypothetical protein